MGKSDVPGAALGAVRRPTQDFAADLALPHRSDVKYTIVYNSDSLIYIVGIIAANLVVLIPYNLIFLVIYRIKHPFFEQYRIYNVLLL